MTMTNDKTSQKRSTSMSGAGDKKQRVSQKRLINQINFNHFQGVPVICRVNSGNSNEIISLTVHPRPVFGSFVVCLWSDETLGKDSPPKTIKEISIPYHGDTIDFTPNIRSISSKGFCISIPESGQTRPRLKFRHSSDRFDGVDVKITRNNQSISAEIIAMGKNTLTVAINMPLESIDPFTAETPASIVITKDKEKLFTGQFIPINTRYSDTRCDITFKPPSPVIHRVAPKRFRSHRQSIDPSPDVGFTSPFHGRYVSLTVHDLSGSGFSVFDEGKNTALITGLHLHNIELNFSGAFSICCSAQMVHRSKIGLENGQELTICGFAFTDMTLENHLKLSGFLQQKQDKNIRLCPRIDEHDLWSFFFETGFIYAQKYRHFLENRNQIRNTYKKIYGQGADIARHVVYMENGDMLGHLAMVRMHSESWLIHHHAALKRSGIKAGLAVLNHLAWFCYNSIWLNECHMSYMMCYFRPDNDFPNFFFNGFADRMNDPSGCSTDTFAYATYRKPSEIPADLPQGWTLSPCDTHDFDAFKHMYDDTTGGLLVDALDLKAETFHNPTLDDIYRDAGLTRQRLAFSFKHRGVLKAIFLINLSDVALNMSDLTHCITVFAVEEKGLNKDLITDALALLSGYFEQNRFPVLLYPLSFAETMEFHYEKQYILWILATKYSDHYFQFLDEINAISRQTN